MKRAMVAKNIGKVKGPLDWATKHLLKMDMFLKYKDKLTKYVKEMTEELTVMSRMMLREKQAATTLSGLNKGVALAFGRVVRSMR